MRPASGLLVRAAGAFTHLLCYPVQRDETPARVPAHLGEDLLTDNRDPVLIRFYSFIYRAVSTTKCNFDSAKRKYDAKLTRLLKKWF